MRAPNLKHCASFTVIFVLNFYHGRAKHHRIFDLSHPIFEDMPVWDAGVPPEISMVEQDEGYGLR